MPAHGNTAAFFGNVKVLQSNLAVSQRGMGAGIYLKCLSNSLLQLHFALAGAQRRLYLALSRSCLDS